MTRHYPICRKLSIQAAFLLVIERMFDYDSRPWLPPRATPNSTPGRTSRSSRAPRTPKNWWARPWRGGLPGVALTDRDGLYGAVRFAKAAKEQKLPAICGAELTLETANPEPIRAS